MIRACACGKRATRALGMCRACYADLRDRQRAAAVAIVVKGVCPQCTTPLRRNLALPGWFQCDAYGEPSFRAPAHRDLPRCSFQTFTE